MVVYAGKAQILERRFDSLCLLTALSKVEGQMPKFCNRLIDINFAVFDLP